MHFKPEEYKQLDVDLPVQKLVNTRKAGIAGILLVVIFLLLTVYAYLSHKVKQQDNDRLKPNITLNDR